MKIFKSKLYIIVAMFFSVLLVASVAYSIAPAYENFDSAGMGDKGLQSYTLNGITYSTNDTGGLNINIVNDGNIASGGDYALGYRSSGVNSTTQTSFATSDGSEFKLNSFVISTGLGDTTVTIKAYRDNSEVASSSITTASFVTFDVSSNSNWENIDEVRMSGADLDIDIDDLDFSEAVLPTYSVTYNGNSNSGGSVPIDASAYSSGDTVTILGNTGGLVKTGYTFNGWNTAANGSGTSYNGGAVFSMGSTDVTLYAQWIAIDYSVTYDGNSHTGGSLPTDGTSYNITDTVTVLGNTGDLVKTGYIFNSWNTAANGSGTAYTAGQTFSMGSSNVTLFAQWTENTYTVTYNGNNSTGGVVPTDGTSYHNGDTATVLGNTGSLVRTGYTFNGWNTAANGSGTSYTGSDTFGVSTSDVTLYAQWTAIDYSVTYDGNSHTGGTVPTDGTSYNITDTVTVLGNTGDLVKTGYIFNGWNTAANGSGTAYTDGQTFSMGSSNVTLFAQWTENTYTVTYNGNNSTGGAVPTDGTSYHNGDTATVLGNTGSLVRTGYTFNGWNTAPNGIGTAYTGGDTFGVSTSDVTLYAQWTAINYSVTYDGNSHTGGTVPTDGTSYNITDTVTVLGNTGDLVKTGYIFNGWNTAANGSGTAYTAGQTFSMGSSNVTLFAQWTENTYTVTYNGNNSTGGAVPTDGTNYHNGDTATVLGNTESLVRTGYTFNGWNTAPNGSGTSYTGSDTFGVSTSDVTLYAQWTAIDYSVTYDGNTHTGGTVPTDGTSYNITDAVTILGNTGDLVKTGYIFNGWNTAANGSGTAYTAGQTFSMGSSNVTLFAQWTENTYTVTYNGNNSTGGAVPTDGTSYHNGDTATVLGNTGSLVRTGYTFNGWNTAANGSGTAYTAGQTFSMGEADVILYGQYTINQYVVTFESNGGSVVNPVTQNYDTLVTIPTPPTRSDYTFVGWFKEAALTTKWDFTTDKLLANDMTLYGKWNVNSGGGSSGSSSSSSITKNSQNETTSKVGSIVVRINGQEESAGKETVIEVSGEKITQVKLTSTVIDAKIESVLKGQDQENSGKEVENIIEVPIKTQDAKKITTILTGEIVNKMDKNNFDLSIVTDSINYVIPAKEFGIKSVAKDLGVEVEELKNIEIEVQINKDDEKTRKAIMESAKAKAYEIVFSPVTFEVLAKTKTTSGEEKQVTVSTFKQYVQRVMKLPKDVDQSKISTGIVYNEDGTFSHVPTRIFLKDGHYYAEINSLTNSSYSVIWNQVRVESVKNHWSNVAVNDLASRLVIENPSEFMPNQDITRGEFAEYITKALGLYRTNLDYTLDFTDVDKSHKLSSAIQVASEYGIIKGYPDGTFRPNSKISREEAMVMYSKAMEIVGLDEIDNNRIAYYNDTSLISKWAFDDVKKTVSVGVFNGKTKETINPKETFTLAEAATAIRNLLLAADLINQ